MEGDVTWSGNHWSCLAEIPAGPSVGFPTAILPTVGGGIPVPDQKGSGMSQLNQPKMVSFLQDFSEPFL